METTAVLLGIVGFERTGVGLRAEGFDDPAVGEVASLDSLLFLGTLFDRMVEVDRIACSIAFLTL